MAVVRVPEEAWGDVEAEGLLNRWLVPEGARVAAGQPIAEVVIVKSTMEVAAPRDGTLTRVLVPEQGTFGRGQDLAIVD